MQIRHKLHYLNLLALMLGVLGGMFIPQIFQPIKLVGQIYLNLLKIMLVPLLFIGISSAISQTAPKKALKAILIFFILFVSSFLICGIIYSFVDLNIDIKIPNQTWDGEILTASLSSLANYLFPDNLVECMANNALLPVIIFSMLFGLAIKKEPEVKELMVKLTKALNRILDRITHLAPLGIFVLTGLVVSKFDMVYHDYIMWAVIGCLAVLVLLMILPVWIFCGINPILFIRRISKVMIMAFASSSSMATLPFTLRVCNDDLQIPRDTTDVVVPLGCVIHMCGCAVSMALLSIVTLQYYNIPLTLDLFVKMLLGALIFNIGMPGVPGGSLIIEASYLAYLGLPLNIMGVYVFIYPLVSGFYAILNVVGDITTSLLVNRREY